MKVRVVKRTVVILLIFSLIYSNLSMLISGCVSFALDEIDSEEATESVDTVKELDIQLSDFYKNNMAEQETDYSEQLSINLSFEDFFNEVVVSDVDSGVVADDVSDDDSKINTFYRTTKINKTELINVIGSNGSFEVYFEVLDGVDSSSDILSLLSSADISDAVVNEVEVEESSEESNVESSDEEKGIIVAENGSVVIDSSIEADDDGFITIVYPDSTISVDFKFSTDSQVVESFNIVNYKFIEKVESLEEVNRIEVSKQIVVTGEDTLLDSVESVTKDIIFTQTFAELGIDKTQISTSVENKVNFTITMHTNDLKYDLFKNPYFIIQLPDIVDFVSVDDVIILNNPYFEISEIEEGSLENGNKAIGLKLEGEQTEYTKSIEENIQIVVETTISTQDLLPTTQKDILLFYQNENVTTYNGVSLEENGFSEISMDFISNEEVIVESTAVVGDQSVSSTRDDFNSVDVEPNTYNSVTILGTAINNLGEDIQNAKILGSASNVGEISGVEIVYYSSNEDANVDLEDSNNGWSSEYVSNAKSFLILIENFAQAETLNFGYGSSLEEDIEDDVSHIAQFEVYNNENEVMSTSKITINQEAEDVAEVVESSLFEAELSVEDAEVGGYTSIFVNIENVSGRKLEDVSLDVSLPENLDPVSPIITINGTEVTGFETSYYENGIKIAVINIEESGICQIEINAYVTEDIGENVTVIANIECEDIQTQVFAKITMISQSTIKTTITSDKLGETLEANETIEYKVTLENVGEAYATVNIATSELENMYIRKIKSENLDTNVTKEIGSNNLDGSMYLIDIYPNETVEIYITCVAKELTKDVVETMYVNITGKKIYSTTTEELTNQINKKVDFTSDIENEVNNSILGIAWLDEDKDGIVDEDETLLKNVKATLVNTISLEEVATETTNSEGEYEFENIEEGNYVVKFNYNTTSLTLTEYKNESASTSLNSSVINTTQSNSTTSKTEVITIEDGSEENVNAGFVINKNFDMGISKGITKVTVNNEQGTEVYEFSNNSMAKVEIDGEFFQGSVILVEYEITVTNTGEVEGYVKTISDEIPAGMEFSSELNTAWYEDEDGLLYCESLSNEKLMPGESAIVELVLIKEMTEDIVVSPVNTVNIEKTFNEYLIEDKNEDNNSSEATIIISLTTGNTRSLYMVNFNSIGCDWFRFIWYN